MNRRQFLARASIMSVAAGLGGSLQPEALATGSPPYHEQYPDMPARRTW
ncbi:MAG: twin-arginine translocation signal domain-containing protein [Terriglobia bacterium]